MLFCKLTVNFPVQMFVRQTVVISGYACHADSEFSNRNDCLVDSKIINENVCHEDS